MGVLVDKLSTRAPRYLSKKGACTMPEKQSPYVWMNGNLIPDEEAKIHVRTACATYGENVFEGIRAYWSDARENLFVFRLDEHLDRLFHSSMKIMRLEVPWSQSELRAALLDLLRENDHRENVQIRLTAYFGLGEPYSFSSSAVESGAIILSTPSPRKKQITSGIQCCVSSWNRIYDNSMPPRVKSGANYHNGRLATYEARINGYDLPILLDTQGRVKESGAASIFIVRGGTVITPPVTDGILESITRETLLHLCEQDLNTRTEVREIGRTELYIADEIFLCGTAAEITPVIGVDRYKVGTGSVGAATRLIQDKYFSVVEGQDPNYENWVTAVY